MKAMIVTSLVTECVIVKSVCIFGPKCYGAKTANRPCMWIKFLW